MASSVPPGVRRPGYPQPHPNFNPSFQRPPPSSLTDQMQSLNVNRPSGPPNAIPNSSSSRPSAFGAPQPFSHSTRTGGPPSPASIVGSGSVVTWPGSMPAGTMPTAPFPAGTIPGVPPQSSSIAGSGSVVPRPGPIPAGTMPSGPFPTSTMPTGPFRTGPMPTGSPRSGVQTIAPPTGFHPNTVRPTGPPFSQTPFGSGPPSGAFPSSASTPPTSGQSPMSSGLPMTSTSGNFHTGTRFPPAGVPQPQPAGPPTWFQRGPPSQGVRPFPGSLPLGSQAVPPSQSPAPPFSGASQGMPPASMSGYPSPMWQNQTPQVPPMLAGTMQPLRSFGMPPSQPAHIMPPGMGFPRGPGVVGMARPGSPISGAPVTVPSKIDPTQIPRPVPSSSVIIFETRHNNQANPPPPANSDYVVKDMGNCSPRYMRCTINQIPCSGDLLTTSSMPLALLVQPLALPHPSEEPIQIVDFGDSGPVRCSRCKGYINPFMKFIDQGRRFICNLCGFTDETPRDYHCNLGPDGKRRDVDERPELCRGTVEFVATKEYMVRDPMPAVFFFLVDVSMNAVQTGATAASCSAISQAINDIPEGPRTMVGIATFDSTIHFYNLKRALQQPLMLIVPDVQDVYTPLQSDLIVPISECRQHLEHLLESIPTLFQNNRVSESAFGAAIKAAFLAIKSTGGKLLVFQSVLPSVGIGALSSREAEGRTNVSTGEKEAHKLLQPSDKILKTMAIEFAEHQVCVDVFITTQAYVDIASISVVPKTTGGQVYYYHPFSAISDSAKLYNDLRWNITRPQGFEAVMRVRCSQGLQVQEYSGSFCKRIPTDVDLPGIDCDKTIMVTFKHDDKFQDGSECAFQCALLYTTVYGQRRIRVITLSLPCTSVLSNLFRSADLDAQFTCFLKQAANEIPTSPLFQVREQMTNLSINILHAYRKFCATVSSSGQLILPEALKLLPLYTLALIKSTGLRTDGRIDDRSYWITHAVSISTTLAVPLVYPRMLAIHNLVSQEPDESLISSSIPLSSEHITDDGVFLLENGEEGLIYVGDSVNSDILQQIFGVSSVMEIPSQFVLKAFDNELSKKLNDVVNEIRRQRCSYLRLRLCKKGDPSGMPFFSQMVEDKTPSGHSYVEFLVHIHRQIQTKMP